MFSIIINFLGSLMHFYVAHRLYALGPVRARVPARVWWVGAVALWAFYLWGVQLGDAALAGSRREHACFRSLSISSAH